MKKALIISGILLAAASLALLAAVLFSGAGLLKLSGGKYETNTYTVSGDFTDIDISSAESGLVFRPSADGTCRVVCVETEKVTHSVSVENAALTVRTEDRRSWYDHLGFSAKSLSLTVYLPEERYEELRIVGSTGDVSVPAPFSFGSADVRISTGDILFEAAAESRLQLRTDTGDIRISGVSAENIGLSVSTGSVEAASVRCREEFSVRVSTGRARLTDVDCKTLRSEGSTGHITLKETFASDSFYIERSTGDVLFEDCDAGQITVRTSTGDVSGTLRTEKVFLPKTSTGRIRVPDTASGGRCEITTSTGSIDIRLSGH